MFGLTDTQILWIVILVLVLIVNYQINDIRSQLKSRLKAKVEKALRWSEPIKVKHNTPRTLTPDGKTRFGAEDYDFECFNSFWYFADWINEQETDGPFRLQELGDTTIRGSAGEEGPAYGRRYEIFYNQCKLGTLEISANLHQHFDRADKSVDVSIAIDHMSPLEISFSNLYGFLLLLASLLTSRERQSQLTANASEYDYAVGRIKDQMLETLWSAHKDDFPSLEIEIRGTPDWYYEIERSQREEVVNSGRAQGAAAQ